MRQDYDQFTARQAEILVLGPDGPNAFRRYWEREQLPFIGMADIKNKVADTYQQEVNLVKLGRMPALLVIDRQGRIRYNHYGDSMSDIPENADILELIDSLNQEEK